MRNILAATVLSFAALSAPAKADIVIDWADFAQTLDTDDQTPWSPENHHTDIQLAITMFEAANAIDRRYESMLGLEQVADEASLNAAVMTAARDVLLAKFAKRKQDIEYSYELALSMIPDGNARRIGIAVGEKAASAALAMPARRGDAASVPYRPKSTPGVWVPVQLPVYPDDYEVVKTWSIDDYREMLPPPPPALDSEEWARALNEVKLIGGKDSETRTSIQSRIARYRITPVIIPMLRSIADRTGRSTVQNARMLALVEIAGTDTNVVTGLAKLKYNFWRPITAIRNADEDGNPDTEIDPTWESLIFTPNHPEYPCAHCSYTAAVAEVLKAEVGNAPEGGVQVGSRSLEFATTQVLPTLDQWVEEVSLSRIYGGVHYRFSNEAGEELGRKVAARALQMLPPVGD
ncbi:vanadium-dependent haloperoxidase [Erythrobacter sp. MTPC3]|uniref:vanadium-dependent haloperoxidase n=1 Tax=Erythrobacter sp. MTPC3 TaxID=3056564 RepID=UPI0036F382C7